MKPKKSMSPIGGRGNATRAIPGAPGSAGQDANPGALPGMHPMNMKMNNINGAGFGMLKGSLGRNLRRMAGPLGKITDAGYDGDKESY